MIVADYPMLGLGLACAALIGFAAHRASLCNVRAVAEVMTSGTAHLLGSLLQATMWAALMAGGLSLLAGLPLPAVPAAASMPWALAGGALFGMGAALNGGCSLSTLHRLADGDLAMLATLAGLVLGVSAWALTLPGAGVFPPGDRALVASFWVRWPAGAPWLLGALALWAGTRLGRLRQAAGSGSARDSGTVQPAPRYSLPAAAALMGLAAGALYATQGAWSYTNHLRASTLRAWTDSPSPSGAHTALVVALVLGMVLSARLRGPLAWRHPTRALAWLRHAAGGLLMGLGAAVVPGGNDTLLLNGLPTLAPQMIGAYLAMLAGIAAVIGLMRLARLPMPPTVCDESGCEDGPAPAR